MARLAPLSGPFTLACLVGAAYWFLAVLPSVSGRQIYSSRELTISAVIIGMVWVAALIAAGASRYRRAIALTVAAFAFQASYMVGAEFRAHWDTESYRYRMEHADCRELAWAVSHLIETNDGLPEDPAAVLGLARMGWLRTESGHPATVWLRSDGWAEIGAFLVDWNESSWLAQPPAIVVLYQAEKHCVVARSDGSAYCAADVDERTRFSVERENAGLGPLPKVH